MYNAESGLFQQSRTVFETSLIGNEQYGSICSGGRYDNFAQNYSKNILPGVGISIGLTRLFYILKEIGFVEQYAINNKVDYLVVPIGDTLSYCCEVLQYLQSKGVGVTIYFEEASLKKKLSYANKLNIGKVILVGEDEANSNKVKIKDMKQGNEVVIDVNDLVK